LYVAVQVIESYILQPLVQKRAVSLPPSVTLLSQVLVGSLFGSLGLILATPLTVAGLTMLNMLYVEDILKKRPTAWREPARGVLDLEGTCIITFRPF
jgi:predicted PurR-regulated permease PerM